MSSQAVRVCLCVSLSVCVLLSAVFSSTGRNEKGQLGHGDTKRLEAPKLIEGLADHVIVAAACGRNHTLALTGGCVVGVGGTPL